MGYRCRIPGGVSGLRASGEGGNGTTALDVDGRASMDAARCVAGNAVEDSNAGALGSDECGDGGGNTNEVGSKDCGIVPTFATGNAGGITSVSNAGSSPLANPRPDDDRLETRIFRPAPALPTTVCLGGDLRGDFRGDLDLCGDDLRNTVGYWPGSETDGLSPLVGVEEGSDEGAGVGGSSASICSTCHDLFSSKNRIRSACNNIVR